MQAFDTQWTIFPGARLVGELGAGGTPGLPGDKSLSHRAALLGALAEGKSTIRNFLVSGVTRPLVEALGGLGVAWRLQDTTLTVEGAGLQAVRDVSPLALDCGNSATTLRLLAGALAAWGRPAVLDGSPGLRRRPMDRIVRPLQQMGVPIESKDGCAPLAIGRSPRPLDALRYTLPVASAQVKSCLLLAALAADGETRLVEPGPSRDHTERMLRSMGVQVSNGFDPGSRHANASYWTSLHPPHPATLSPLDLTLPGDMSAAAFLLVAALVAPGSQIVIRGVGLNPTRTGLLESLIEMGADIAIQNRREQAEEPVGDLSVVYGPLRGVRVGGERVVRMIDEFPAFAVAASYAAGSTIVADADELRHKESDRISALGTELRRLGVDFHETAGGFTIQGGRRLSGGAVEAHGDHRLAMALALAGLHAEAPIEVHGAQVIQESFPDFPAVLQALGAEAQWSA